MADVRLAMTGVSFRYRSLRGIEAVDLAVAAGEIVGLLGPNGSGKSTVVKLASGVLTGYSGSIRLGGDEVSALAPRERARRIAAVPQEIAFEFPFTALEVVLLGRHPHLEGTFFESERDVALAEQALAEVDARPFAGRLFRELSAGERQRVLVARALAQDAPVLALDEAASALDLRHQVDLYDRLRDLAAGGKAILTVLHDLSLTAEYCDRIVLLQEGRVAAMGSAAEVLTYSNLTRVFETEIYVDVNDLTGRLVATPLSARARRALTSTEKPLPP